MERRAHQTTYQNFVPGEYKGTYEAMILFLHRQIHKLQWNWHRSPLKSKTIFFYRLHLQLHKKMREKENIYRR